MILSTRKSRHLRYLDNSIYELRYELLNDAIKLRNNMGRDDLDRHIVKMTIKSKKLIKYNKYLRLLRF
jgi:hypothetical protein